MVVNDVRMAVKPRNCRPIHIFHLRAVHHVALDVLPIETAMAIALGELAIDGFAGRVALREG